MLSDVSRRLIPYRDAAGVLRSIAYGDLLIHHGVRRKVSLADALNEEAKRIESMRRSAMAFGPSIRGLERVYREHDRASAAWHAELRRRTEHIGDQNCERRIRTLHDYFVVSGKHRETLARLLQHILGDSVGDHSEHMKSLIRFALDYTLCAHQGATRRNGRPYALHPIEAARAVAKNGQHAITIIGALLHDVVEERLDHWTEQLIERELPQHPDERYRDCSPKQLPRAVREDILRAHADEYNDRASAIYFAIGLNLFDHIRKFPSPARYYGILHSIMDTVEKLSRTRDVSYYRYIQRFMYPRHDRPDTIRRSTLVRYLAEELHEPGELLDDYLENIEHVYDTRWGERQPRDEEGRNTFREILIKIVDRLNNTRDMARDDGFSISKRLYGVAFKNLYFLQALEDRLALPDDPYVERNMLEVKFLNKPKVAALYQVLEDLEDLEREVVGRAYIDMLETELEGYRHTDAFRQLTRPSEGGPFDGTIYFFNEVILGRKQFLDELDSRRDRVAQYLIAFRALLESFLVYPALISEENERNRLQPGARSRYKRFRIEGMGPALDPKRTELPLKTFRRHVVD